MQYVYAFERCHKKTGPETELYDCPGSDPGDGKDRDGTAVGVYRHDHAVTAKQKTILSAFGINADHVKYKAACIREELKRR